jgi:phage baseplate assembly protein W
MAEFYDINRDFTLNAKGDIDILDNNLAIRQSIESIILTATGAKVGFGPVNTVYGVGVNNYMFAPMTQFAAQSLGESIYRHLTIFESRIDIKNINVTAVTQDKSFFIKLEYSLVGSAEKTQVYKTIIRQL